LEAVDSFDTLLPEFTRIALEQTEENVHPATLPFLIRLLVVHGIPAKNNEESKNKDSTTFLWPQFVSTVVSKKAHDLVFHHSAKSCVVHPYSWSSLHSTLLLELYREKQLSDRSVTMLVQTTPPTQDVSPKWLLLFYYLNLSFHARYMAFKNSVSVDQKQESQTRNKNRET
jgi:hypothetical protein